MSQQTRKAQANFDRFNEKGTFGPGATRAPIKFMDGLYINGVRQAAQAAVEHDQTSFDQDPNTGSFSYSARDYRRLFQDFPIPGKIPVDGTITGTFEKDRDYVSRESLQFNSTGGPLLWS